MSTFFSALNPLSNRSHISFRASKRAYSEEVLRETIPDLTLDLVLPFLWHRQIPISEAIYECFYLLYGDPYDSKGLGVAQKGFLDFLILPLLARKLIGDCYLLERKEKHLLNFFAKLIALPIELITFTLALTCTIAIIPVVAIVSLLRNLFSPKPMVTPHHDAIPMILELPIAFAALDLALHRLETAGIRNEANIRRLLSEPENLSLVYAMERITLVLDANGNPLPYQAIFDFLFENKAYWTDIRVIENLDKFAPANQPEVHLDDLKRALSATAAYNNYQCTSTPSFLNNLSKSAIRLRHLYAGQQSQPIDSIEPKDLDSLRRHNPSLVAQRNDQILKEQINTTIPQLQHSRYFDPVSKVYVFELLSYFYQATNDSKHWRAGVTAESARSSFYSTLYEINQEFILPNKAYDEACIYSKIMREMAKIHTLCETDYLTPATAAIKLPCVIRRVLTAYLAQYPEATELLRHSGLTALWPTIKADVLRAMQTECHAIFPTKNGFINSDLSELVDAGEYLNQSYVPDLPSKSALMTANI